MGNFDRENKGGMEYGMLLNFNSSSRQSFFNDSYKLDFEYIADEGVESASSNGAFTFFQRAFRER